MSETELKKRIIKILEGRTREMEGYSYFSSNPGIPEDEYDEIADELISVLKENEVPNCTECGTPLLFECVGCSRSNYPPYIHEPIGEIVYSGEGGLQIEFYDGKPLSPMKLYAQSAPAQPEVEG